MPNQTNKDKLSVSGDHNPAAVSPSLPDTGLSPAKDHSRSVRWLSRYHVSKIKALAAMLAGIKKNIIKLTETVDTQTKGFESSLNVVKNCQEMAIRIQDQELERHVINPAIRAVVALAEEIDRLKKVSENCCSNEAAGSDSEHLDAEIQISAAIASDKLRHLDIKMICPLISDVFDSGKHLVCGCTEVSDKQLHGKVSNVIAPGFIYRGKVIETAKVSVYRYIDGHE